MKLTEKTKTKIDSWLSQHGIDNYDVSAEWNSSLDLKANKQNIAEQVGIIDRPTKEELNGQKEMNRIQAEEKVREAELEHIEKIKNTPDDLDKFYLKLKDMIEVVQKSKQIHGMICIGDAGIGKSYSIQKNVDEHYILLSGHITPIQLYLNIQRNPDSVIIIDDATDVFSNKDTYSILLQALNTDEIRIVHWHSMILERQDISMFSQFRGKIIIIHNEITDGLDTLLSRCYLREIKFSFQERMEMLYAFAKKKNIPSEIVDFIKDNHIIESNLNFRLVMKIYEFYRTKNEKWKEMALEELNIDERIRIVYELEKEPIPTKERVRKWQEKTNYSRASYFLYKKKARL